MKSVGPYISLTREGILAAIKKNWSLIQRLTAPLKKRRKP